MKTRYVQKFCVVLGTSQHRRDVATRVAPEWFSYVSSWYFNDDLLIPVKPLYAIWIKECERQRVLRQVSAHKWVLAYMVDFALSEVWVFVETHSSVVTSWLEPSLDGSCQACDPHFARCDVYYVTCLWFSEFSFLVALVCVVYLVSYPIYFFVEIILCIRPSHWWWGGCGFIFSISFKKLSVTSKSSRSGICSVITTVPK